jgi:hypothetical protein
MLSVLEGWDGAAVRFVEVIRKAAARAGVEAPWSLGELPWSPADEEFFFDKVSGRETRDRIVRRKPSGSLMLLVALFLKARRVADRGDFWRSVFDAFDGTEWLLFRSADTQSIHREHGKALVRAAKNNGLRHEREMGGNRFVHTVQFQYGISLGELADPKSLLWIRNPQIGSTALREMLADERMESFRIAMEAIRALANGRSSSARFLLESELNPWLWFANDLVLPPRGGGERATTFGGAARDLVPTLRWDGDRPILEVAVGAIPVGSVPAGGTLYLGSAGVPLQPQSDGSSWLPRDVRVPFEPNVFLGVLGADGWQPEPQWHAESLLVDGHALLRVGRPLDSTIAGVAPHGTELAVVLADGLSVTGGQLRRVAKLSGGFRAELHRVDGDSEFRVVDGEGNELQCLEPRRSQTSAPADLSMTVRSSAERVLLGEWVTIDVEWTSTSHARPRAVSLGDRLVPLVAAEAIGAVLTASARVRMPCDGLPSPRVFVRGIGPNGPWLDSRATLEGVDVFGSVITDERGARRMRPHDPVCLTDAVREIRVVLPADLRRHWGTQHSLPVFLGNRLVGELVDERVRFFAPDRLLSFGELLAVDRDIIGGRLHVFAWQPIRSGELAGCDLSADARSTRFGLRRPLRLEKLRCTYRAYDGSFVDAALASDGELVDFFEIDNSRYGAPAEIAIFDEERVYGVWSSTNKKFPGQPTIEDVCWSMATGLPLRGRRIGAQERFKLPPELVVDATRRAVSSSDFRWPISVDARIAWLQTISPSVVAQIDEVTEGIADLTSEPQVQALLGFGCPILRAACGTSTVDEYRSLTEVVDAMHVTIAINDVLADYLETALMQPRVLSNPQLFVYSVFSQLRRAELRERGV